MKKRDLILIGGGGHCKAVIDVAECAGYNILGVIDPFMEKGENVLGYPILGGDDEIEEYINQASFVIAMGFITNPRIRQRLYKKVLELGGVMETIIAPTAHVSRYATLGEGTIIMHNVCVNARSVIGNNVIVNTCANIEHDVVIGDNCHISTGAIVNGNCCIGSSVFVGSRTVILNKVAICDDVIIGAGSVVCKSIDSRGIYYGNPSKFIKTNEN